MRVQFSNSHNNYQEYFNRISISIYDLHDITSSINRPVYFVLTGIWVHVEGYNTPLFDENGWVTACDSTGDFINDIITFLDAAEASNILVTLTLWNGAVVTNQVYIDLIRDPNKLQSYLDNCLTVSYPLI